MENVIDSIRAALAPDATPEVRATGASACRAILTALEGAAGQPLASAAATPPTPSPIAAVVGALRGVPPDQLLDMAITRLRAALPAGVEVPPSQRINFQMIPHAQLATLGGRTS